MRRLVGRHAVIRVLVVWVIMAVTLYVLSAFIPEIDFPGWGSAFAIAAVIGLLNAVVWPLFVRFALPITVLTLGVAALLLNGVIVSIASSIVDGFGVGVLWGIVATFILTVVNTVVTSLLGIDDDDFYYRNVIQRAAARQGATSSDVPGVIFLEIDGLAHEVVVRALRNGNMPMVGRWLREGTHHLIRWETDWSSQTGACQAGLLHGNSEDWPAFRWWEKEHKRPIVTNHPKDAAELERRHSNGRGLLHEDGASRANILSGDAKHSLLTMSTVLRRDRPGRIGQDYFAYFANPYNITRTVMLALADIAQELYYAAQQRRRDIRPRIKRTLTYALVRYCDSARPPGVGDHRRPLRRQAGRLHNLSCHPGIGFMLVRSERHGAVAIGAHGTHYLDEDRVEGEDPLAPFGPNAARHVRRADGFEHVADLMVNSTYYAEIDEVAAFEELVGSHGGMGGSQSFPFVVLPAGWRLPEQAIVGPDHMHRHMRRWLADLGHERYQDASPEAWSG